jgi:hypothetical protein|tara:strand:- start:272 stop:580 length:309 start_codon:yes stop_codon:yes gene_type:complete
MRNIYGTTHSSTASVAIQFGTTQTNERVLWANMKARDGNGTPVYIGHSSSVNSTNGYELVAGAALPRDYRNGSGTGSISGSRFWMVASSTASQLDFSMGVDD